MTQSNSLPRFVVLHHIGVPQPHFDLMLERSPGEPLETWRSPSWPLTGETVLSPLVDHRSVYLTYEGPVSNANGEVRRVFAATVVGQKTVSTGGIDTRTIELVQDSVRMTLVFRVNADGTMTGSLQVVAPVGT